SPVTTLGGSDAVTELDASGSTGGIVYWQFTEGMLSTIHTGLGNDIIAPLFVPEGETLVVDTGAGDDILLLWDGLMANNAVDINLGEGDDMVALLEANDFSYFLRDDSVIDG